jgi:4-amino-4-deoxy-L-arabinose transferase-like glycosyltransferase
MPFLLILVSSILLFTGLSGTPMYILDEVKNAQCAREMMERGDWIVPTFNQELRVAKPPLHYFFMRAGYMAWGNTPFGARFFSAVMGILTTGACWAFVKRFSSVMHALLTCCILLCSTHFLFEFRLAVPDPYLIFFCTAGLFCAYAYTLDQKLPTIICAAMAMALGILSKGPVAIAIPGLAWLCFLIWERKLKILFNWHIPLAVIVLLSVSTPWYLAVHYATQGAWTRGFFLENNLNRLSGPMEGHGGIFLVVPIFVWVGMLPASAWIASLFSREINIWKHPINRFSACVVLANLVVFSFSGTKLPNYPMPAYPFLAILIGFSMCQLMHEKFKKRRYPLLLLVILNLAISVGTYFAIRSEPALKGIEYLAWGTTILPTGAIAALFLHEPKRISASLLTIFTAYMLFHLVFFRVLYPKAYQRNPVEMSRLFWSAGKPIVAFQGFNPAFVFATNRQIRQYVDSAMLRQYLDLHPETLVISRSDQCNVLEALGLMKQFGQRDLFEHHTTVIYARKGVSVAEHLSEVEQSPVKPGKERLESPGPVKSQ